MKTKTYFVSPNVLKKALPVLLFSFSLGWGQVTVETVTGPFDASGGVTTDSSGEVFVADFGPGLGDASGTNIYHIMDDGSIVLYASGLVGASGNDFDSQGNLFQANIRGNYLSKVTPDGTVVDWATREIYGPVGVAVDAGDTVFVANCGINTIARVLPNGNSMFFAANPILSCPNGLTIDADGNLYTCNFNDGNIIKITKEAKFSLLATLPGGRCGHLVAFEGNLYAVARCAQQIYKVTLDGLVILVAGSGGRGNDDGAGLDATFNHPNGIDARRRGDNVELFVNDAVSLEGDCTTVPLNPVVMRKITIRPPAPEAEIDTEISTITLTKSLLQAGGDDSTEVVISPVNSLNQFPADSISQIVVSLSGKSAAVSPMTDNLDGTYSVKIRSPIQPGHDTISVTVVAGVYPFTLREHPILTYWSCGDINGSLNGPNISDLTYLVDYLFSDPPGPAPQILAAADMSGDDGSINISDLTYLVAYLFGGGPAPDCAG